MSLDGFSLSNIKMNRELTSAQMASQADQLASKGLEFKIKDVSELASNKGVKRKEEDSNQDEGTFNDGFQENEESDETEANTTKTSYRDSIKEELIIKEIEEKDPKEFSVRINSSNDMIELYNNKNKKIIETISANDLMELISKLDSASGILVNRKI